MFGRRILVLVAVLMGLTALAASLAPPPESIRRGRATPTPTPARTATPAPGAAATASDSVSARLRAGGRPRTITAAQGDTVQIDVTGDVLDTVVIPGLAIAEPIDPESPAHVELYADAAGRYPIGLLDAGRRIGWLRITPAG